MPDVTSLLAELVRIESTNPDLVTNGSGETAIADFITAWLKPYDFEIHRLERLPGRPSIVAIHPGTGGGHSLMLNGHIDTVTLAGCDGDPLNPVIADGRLHGRGAFDMKSGVAASMVAAVCAAASPHRGDIMLALVADEEYASTGTAEVLESFVPDAAIVTEPSNLQLMIAHRGFVWLDIVFTGVAAHGSRWDLGVDAVAKTGRFLTALDDLSARLTAPPSHPLLHSSSLHVGTIRGGEERSSYPAQCVVAVEYRTLPGEDAATVIATIEDLLTPIRADSPKLGIEVRLILERNPFSIDPDHPLVRSVQLACSNTWGHEAPLRGEPFWTDCALYADAGVPVVMIGASGEGAHAAAEWVDLNSVDDLTNMLTDLLTTFTA